MDATDRLPGRPIHEDAADHLAPDELAEIEACLCLRHCPGLGARTWKKLFGHFGQARLALAEASAWPSLGLCHQAVAAEFGRAKARALLDRARREIEAALARGLTILPFSHPAYPFLLREIPDPPVLLYLVGDASLLAGPAVALVGARQCSRYGFESAWRLAADLSAAGVTVVSGLAFGIDRQAHLGGLTGPGSSVAVLGTGLDLVYPDANLDVWKELADGGAIVSEFPPGTAPMAQNFPIRNRIIAGLSLGVMVVEAAKRSGSLITARLALDQGREVFALPGPVTLPTFAGCHGILTQGAALVQSAEDILLALAPLLAAGRSARSGRRPAPARQGSLFSPPPSAPSAGSRPVAPGVPGRRPAPQPQPASRPASQPIHREVEDEDQLPPELDLPGLAGAVAALLADGARHHIDAIGRTLGAGSGELSRSLIELEMKGLVRKWPGMYYSLDR